MALAPEFVAGAFQSAKERALARSSFPPRPSSALQVLFGSVRVGRWLVLVGLGISIAAAPASAAATVNGFRALAAAKAPECCLFVSIANAVPQSQLLALDRKPPYEPLGVVAPEPGGLPWFLAVGPNGTLYAGDPATWAVYQYGNGFAQPPTRKYPQGGDPVRLAVDESGTLYVAVSVDSSATSYVVEYPRGRRKPRRVLTGPTGFFGLSLAVDRKKSVYIASETTASGPIQLITYPRGSSSGTTTNLNTGGAGLLSGGLAVDRDGNLLLGLVDANLCPHAYIYPPGQNSPTGEIGPPEYGDYCGSASNIRSLSLSGNRLYMGMLDSVDSVIEFTYPSGTFVGGLPRLYQMPFVTSTAVGDSQPSL